MGKQLLLPYKFTDFLEKQPETGTGYHIVDIELINEVVLIKRTVLNSSILILLENEFINENDIKQIKISGK